MQYSKNVIEQELVDVNGYEKFENIDYERVKQDVSLLEVIKEVKIVSGELNIFIYRKDTSSIRTMLEKFHNIKMELFMQNNVLVDKSDGDRFEHEMVDAINKIEDKNIFFLKEKVPAQLMLIDNILYIYGYHTRFQINYNALQETGGIYSAIPRLGNLRDKIAVTKITLNANGQEVIKKYFNYISRDENLDFTISDEFDINDKRIVKDAQNIDDIIDEYVEHYTQEMQMYGDLNNIEDIKKHLPANSVKELPEMIYKKYNELYG